MPRDYTLEGLANPYSVAVGRALPWETEYGKRGAPFSAADTAEGLSGDEVARAADTCQALKDEWLQGRDWDHQARQLAAQRPAKQAAAVVARADNGASLCPA